MKALKAAFKAPQRSVKIKIQLNFFSSSGIRTGRDKIVIVRKKYRIRSSLLISLKNSISTSFPEIELFQKLYMKNLACILRTWTFLIRLQIPSRTFTTYRTAGEREGRFFNSSLPLPSTSQILYGQSLQRAHLCTQPAARLEPGTFGFRAQATNH